jgi:hypothetical protein
MREHDLVALLRTVSRSGWTDETASRFDRELGDDIRRLIVLYLWKLGLVTHRFDPSRAQRLLQAHCLEVFESTISDVWLALARGLLEDYLHELGTRPPGSLPFRRYIAGVVRNLVLENARRQRLLPRHSELELLRSICAAQREHTKRSHVARAMFYLQSKAEREILGACPPSDFDGVYAHLYRVVHHFFEHYVPGQCARIVRFRGSGATAALADSYMKGEYRGGFEHEVKATPWDPGATKQVLGHSPCEETDLDEGEFLALLALREAT